MPSILIADDSKSIRMMVSFTLKAAGYDVTECEDGLEALKQAQSSSFELVISDVNMPNMGGFELTSELRALTNFKATPIILLTTESSRDKKKEGVLAGASGWIVKPFNPETLLKTVKKFTD